MLKITIETDNDAFADGNVGSELSRILHELAEEAHDVSSKHLRFKVRDINGNVCGELKYTPED